MRRNSPRGLSADFSFCAASALTQFLHGVARSASSNGLNSRLFERNLNPVDLVLHSDDEEVDGVVSVVHYG